jgi:hypothetical protein
MDVHRSYYQGYVVTGIYGSHRELDNAVQLLKLDGFPEEWIATLGPPDDGIRINVTYSNDTKAPEGAALGGALGFLVGGFTGYLELQPPGLWNDLSLLGDLESFISAFAGAGAGALIGMISGGLLGFVMPEHTIHITNRPHGSGSFLLSVHCEDSDWCDRAVDIFEQTGAKETSTTTSREYIERGSPPFPVRLG